MIEACRGMLCLRRVMSTVGQRLEAVETLRTSIRSIPDSGAIRVSREPMVDSRSRNG